jgi:UDP-N-acetylglucosamine transferase subunit ALG13
VTYRVLVTVGTDFHPFDRLVTWADRWAEQHPDCTVVVQHGSSRPPQRATGSAFFTNDELLEQMAAADVVVTHGGPATITETRRRRRMPVCVPRDPNLGEHVDDHQQRFARFLGSRDLVRLVQTENDFAAALDDPEALLLAPEGSSDEASMPEGVLRIGEIVADLVTRHRAR